MGRTYHIVGNLMHCLNYARQEPNHFLVFCQFRSNVVKYQQANDTATYSATGAIRTASANSMESDLGCTTRVYFDSVTLKSHNETLTSQKMQKPRQYNNKIDWGVTNGSNIPQYAIKEEMKYPYRYLIEKKQHKLHLFYFNSAEPICYRTIVCAGAILKGSACLLRHIMNKKMGLSLC